MPPEDKYDFPVLVPYSVLESLLQLPRQLEETKKILKHHNRMIGALRGQMIEIVDKLRESK